MRTILTIFVVCVGLVAAYAFAAPGDPDRFGGPQQNQNHETRVDPSAATTILQGHMSPGVAVTTLQSSLSGWKSVYMFNDSSVNCCATFDASNPVTTSGGKCTKGTPLQVGSGVSRDYGLPYAVKLACSGATDAATGADISYEITK